MVARRETETERNREVKIEGGQEREIVEKRAE